MPETPTPISDKSQRENDYLIELAKKPFLTRSFGYIRMTGPGLLQSAMTLGAGSAAASVIAGASFGYKLLWVQPVAMFLGVIMFAAISNIVLTNKERPYRGFMRELGGIWGGFIAIVFLWAFGSILASVIWHFPQYGLAAGAVRSVVEQFAPGILLQNEQGGFTPLGYFVSFAAGIIILLINVTVVFNYGRGGIGIRIYEWFLRCMIALVILTFLLVVLLNFEKIDWLEMGKGFIGYYGIPSYDAKTITVVLGMLGAAVGINMTFLYPYSLLKKGWGEHHKTLVKWDLGMTMFLPFVLVTSLIIVGMTVSGIYTGADVVNEGIKPLQAAAALESSFIPQWVATIIFCGGLIGMACGAISAHMTCCGFVLCEMLGLEQTTWRFRLFAMTPSIGILGVVFQLPFWFPVAASAICLTMLPIAYLIFLIMNNRRSYLGDAVGKGTPRLIFNIILVIALLVATIGAAVKIKSGVYDKIKDNFFETKPAVKISLLDNKEMPSMNEYQ
ncbi:MAG: divalent metal cation transporter [Thermoguttaceae bacterium]